MRTECGAFGQWWTGLGNAKENAHKKGRSLWLRPLAVVKAGFSFLFVQQPQGRLTIRVLLRAIKC